MKHIVKLAAAMSALALVCASCSKAHGDATSQNAYFHPETSVVSDNQYDLVISEQMVTYTIDASTPEGKMRLNDVSQKTAEKLALTGALQKFKCAALINPQYDFLKKGSKILRVTVFGYPARYKNQEWEEVDEDDEPSNVSVTTEVEYTTPKKSTKTKTQTKSRTKKKRRRR